MFKNVFALYVLIFVIRSFEVNAKEEKEIPKIAIIGGGIGGTATAYFLKELFKDGILLDLYEPGSIGGRLTTSSKFDKEYEMGGAIIHPRNLYMGKFIKQFGLEKKDGCDTRFGIFNGEEYKFIDSSWEIVNMVKFLMRYGLDVYWLQKLNKKMLDNFSRIYNYQEQGISFKTLSGLLASMDASFPSMVEVSVEEYFRKEGLHELIIKELVAATTRANFGQSPAVHAFVGSVSVAAADPQLWSVVGGNKRVPEELLRNSKATRIQRLVTKISPAEGGLFRVFSQPGEGQNVFRGSVETVSNISEEEIFKDYDAVAIATPLTKDKSHLHFADFNESFEFPGHYQRVVCTLVQGELNENTFKFKEAGEKIEEILTDNPSLFYNSVGKQFPVTNNKKDCSANIQPVFKIFSPERLTVEQLNVLFKSYNDTEIIDWLAYPHYPSNGTLGKFEIVPGLFYNNAIENAASAMEMSVIAAKNVALLIYKYFKGDDVFIAKKFVKDEF